MKTDPVEHVLYRIRTTPARPYPFSHFYVENVFPQDYYQKILAHLPDTEHYTPIDQLGETQGQYSRRLLFSLQKGPDKLREEKKEFWRSFMEQFGGPQFQNAILSLFSENIDKCGWEPDQQLKSAVDLVRDTTTYSIGPHTDVPRKCVTLIFYLARDDRHPHFGTSLFTPCNTYFEDPLCGHHPFENFKLIATMPYKANAVFGFVRSANSWHGVLPIEEESAERDSLCYCIRLA